MAKDSSKAHWVGFDLGGTKMQASVYDPSFTELGKERKKTKSQSGMKAGLERIVKVLSGALEKAGVDYKDLAGIGVGCPGPLDLDAGVIIDTPNLGWSNVPIRKVLEDAFGCPAYILNDVDAGVYGEYRFGAAKKARCAVGFFPGTGLGGGCVYEGKILRGKTGSCFEVGHIQVLPEGPLCGCGQRGCLETVASRLAIASQAVAAAYRGAAPHLLETAGMDLSNIRSSTLRDSIAAGDEAIEQIVREAAQWLGHGVANIVNLMAPDVVILGGGLVEAMPDLFKEEVEEMALARVMPSFRDTFTVRIAKLGDEATVLGAAAWAEHCAKEK